MVGLGRFMVSLGQFRSVWVGSWSIWVSLGRFMVWVGSWSVWVSLGQLGTVHGRFESVWVGSW